MSDTTAVAIMAANPQFTENAAVRTVAVASNKRQRRSHAETRVGTTTGTNGNPRKKQKVDNRVNQDNIINTGDHSMKCTWSSAFAFGSTSVDNNANITAIPSKPNATPAPEADMPQNHKPFQPSPTTIPNRPNGQIPVTPEVTAETNLLRIPEGSGMFLAWNMLAGNKDVHVSRSQTSNKPQKIGKKVTKSSFLAQAPSDKHRWDDLREISKCNTPDIMFNILQTLVLRDGYSQVAGQPQSTRSSPKEQETLRICPQLLREYQQLRKTLDTQGETRTPISRYTDLMFACLCLVAAEEGLSPKALKEAIVAYWPRRKYNRENWLRLKTAVKQIACAIEDIDGEAGYRGSQLFLMKSLPMETFRTISESANTAKGFAEDLAKKLDSTGAEAAGYDLSFSPAYLITCMGVELKNINKALGTNLSPQKVRLRSLQYRTRLQTAGERNQCHEGGLECGTQAMDHEECPQSSDETSSGRYGPEVSTQQANHQSDVECLQAYHGKHRTKQHMSLRAEESLLSLICAMETIPKFILEQAGLPQKRWTEPGMEFQIGPQDMQLDQHLKDLLMEPGRLWQILEYFISAAYVEVEKSNDVETYIASRTLDLEQRPYWLRQGLYLFCYMFPRDPAILSRSMKESLWIVLENLLRGYAVARAQIPPTEEVLETFLKVSKCGALARRHVLLSQIDRLLDKSANVQLHAELVYQQSVVLRLKGNIRDSQRLLQDFLDRVETAHQLRSHPILGFLYLSQSANHAYNSDFSSAEKEARKWAPREAGDIGKQFDIVWSQINTVGRIMRGQGNFRHAFICFQRCYDAAPLRESQRHLALSHLVDTFVEVDYEERRDICSEPTGIMLERVQAIELEIEHLRGRALLSRGYRRLLLSMSEVEIRRGQLVEARRLLEEVASIYDKLGDLDIIDRLGHIRALMALARISPLSESESRWNDALRIGRKYYPLEEEVFIVAFIHLSICVVRLRCGDSEGARAAFDYAAGIGRTTTPQFLIPGVGTFLLDEMQNHIASLTGWRLVWHEPQIHRP